MNIRPLTFLGTVTLLTAVSASVITITYCWAISGKVTSYFVSIYRIQAMRKLTLVTFLAFNSISIARLWAFL
jgi:hypothetical protein